MWQVTADKAAIEIKRWLVETGEWMDGNYFQSSDEHRAAGHNPVSEPLLVLFVDGFGADFGLSAYGTETRYNDFIRMLHTLGLNAVDDGSWWYFFRLGETWISF